jgi:hypothetical protein
MSWRFSSELVSMLGASVVCEVSVGSGNTGARCVSGSRKQEQEPLLAKTIRWLLVALERQVGSISYIFQRRNSAAVLRGNQTRGRWQQQQQP